MAQVSECLKLSALAGCHGALQGISLGQLNSDLSVYPMTPKGSLYTSYSTPSAVQSTPTHQGYETSQWLGYRGSQGGDD